MKWHRWDDPNAPKPGWQIAAEQSPEEYWGKRHEQPERLLDPNTFPGITFGRNPASGKLIGIDPKILHTHMHVVGATGVGKSFFLEGIIKNLIVTGQGVCLIDPHGSLYHRVLDFCVAVNGQRPDLGLSQRVIPFDIANRQHIMGFNPVQRNARIKIYQVVALMEAVRKCWGQGSFQETPRLARWLFNTLYAVVDSETTFLQTYDMVNPHPSHFRQAITKRISNPHVKAEWEYLARIKSPEKREERVESCLNRIRPFVEHDVIRHIVGQHTNTIDFNSVLSGQKIFLVNLSRQNIISDDDRHLLGTLLVNELLTAAFARPEGKRDPYYLFIDEFQHFVTKDICEILDGGRKFGLHLVLAHQHLKQLSLKDPDVYYSTLTNARTKVVFGGLIDEDLDVLGKEIYTGELNPDEVKSEIWQTKFRPVETTRIIMTESESSGGGSSRSEVSHRSLTEAASYIPDSALWSLDPISIAHAESLAEGGGTSESENWARSSSRTEVPFIEQHEFSELSSRQFRSIEEQLFIKKKQMKQQGRQHAVVLIPGEPVEMVKVPTLADFPVSASQKKEFLEQCFESAGCFKTPKEAEREVKALEESLLVGGKPNVIDVAAVDDDSDLFS